MTQDTSSILQMSQSNDESEKTPEKATLSQFIDENYKLITSMAAFIALTAFSSQVNDSETKTYVAGLALLAAALLAMELFFKLPFGPQHWRLKAFEFILVFLIFSIGNYWFLQFPGIWGPTLSIILVVVIFAGPPSVLAYIVEKVLKAATQMKPEARTRVSGYVFLFSFALLYLLVMMKLGGHHISIHLPKL
jgi:hypothetical protein